MKYYTFYYTNFENENCNFRVKADDYVKAYMAFTVAEATKINLDKEITVSEVVAYD